MPRAAHHHRSSRGASEQFVSMARDLRLASRPVTQPVHVIVASEHANTSLDLNRQLPTFAAQLLTDQSTHNEQTSSRESHSPANAPLGVSVRCQALISPSPIYPSIRSRFILCFVSILKMRAYQHTFRGHRPSDADLARTQSLVPQ